MAKQVFAFTTALPFLTDVLQSEVKIGPAFDHRHSPEPALFDFSGIWDTGATSSAISKNVVQKCGLKPTGMTKVQTAGGLVDGYTYLVCIKLPNKVGFSSLRVTEVPLTSTDVLIGMDVIVRGDFSVTNYQGKTTFSYRHPSIEKIDFVDVINRSKAPGKITRNEPCPCGSGKKYKKCCGA